MFSRAGLAERLGGIVYGTIVALSVIVAGAKAYPDDTTRIAVLVAGTTVVFWLAHAYAHALTRSARTGERLTLAEVRHIGRHEAALILAGAPSIVVLLLGSLDLLDADTAIWLAIGLGLAVLGVQGVVFARIERLGPAGTVTVVAVNLAFGLLLVALKLLVAK
ncbi:MAG TPA: hypothetical protein VJT68_07545 [Thermoleophilaceae bacterium]|nr:hypothetical protein [Thermoleophilaceae bacterium]